MSAAPMPDTFPHDDDVKCDETDTCCCNDCRDCWYNDDAPAWDDSRDD